MPDKPTQMIVIPPKTQVQAPVAITQDELDDYRKQIIDANHQTIAAIFHMGRLLSEAKARLRITEGHGSFTEWVENSLPFGIRNAQYYMDIYEHLGFLGDKRNAVSLLDEDGNLRFGVFSLNFAIELVKATKKLGEQKVIKLLSESTYKTDSDLKELRKKIAGAINQPPKTQSGSNKSAGSEEIQSPPTTYDEYKVAYAESFEKAIKKVAGKRFAAIVADPRKMKDVNTPAEYKKVYDTLLGLREAGGFIALYIPHKKIKDILAAFGDDITIGVRSTNATTYIDDDFEAVIMNTETEPNTATADNIVNQYCREGGKVLDLFCDSMTHGVSCVRTGRAFIGFEANEKMVVRAQAIISDAFTINPLLLEQKRIIKEYDYKLTEVSDEEKNKLMDAFDDLKKGIPATVENVRQEKIVNFDNLDDFYDFFRDKNITAKPRIEAWHLFPDAYVADILRQYYEGGEKEKKAMKRLLEKQASRVGTKTNHKVYNDDLFTAAKKALDGLK